MRYLIRQRNGQHHNGDGDYYALTKHRFGRESASLTNPRITTQACMVHARLPDVVSNRIAFRHQNSADEIAKPYSPLSHEEVETAF